MPKRCRALVVDDESELADLYELWLVDSYDVATAYGGDEALERVDSATDIVLLDRRMPGVPGDEVLAGIRDRGLDCRVAMVTAVSPDFDVLGMAFDEYLSKPASSDELRAVADRLRRRHEYDETVRRYLALLRKRALLEAEKPSEVLRSNDEYAALVAEIDALEADVGDRTPPEEVEQATSRPGG